MDEFGRKLCFKFCCICVVIQCFELWQERIIYTKYVFYIFIEPQYDSTGVYQATGSSLSSGDVLSSVETMSYSTKHYAFLTGSDGSGAIGIAWLGTACLRTSNGKCSFPNYK